MPINEAMIESTFKRRRANSTRQFLLNYKNYLHRRKLIENQKIVCCYKNAKLALTHKQLMVLELVANGFSNVKIAKKLGMKESTIKLFTYRIMRYLERSLIERIDRFSLVIIAQGLDFSRSLNGKNENYLM